MISPTAPSKKPNCSNCGKPAHDGNCPTKKRTASVAFTEQSSASASASSSQDDVKKLQNELKKLIEDREKQANLISQRYDLNDYQAAAGLPITGESQPNGQRKKDYAERDRLDKLIAQKRRELALSTYPERLEKNLQQLHHAMGGSPKPSQPPQATEDDPTATSTSLKVVDSKGDFFSLLN